jgi:hypothetical protein
MNKCTQDYSWLCKDDPAVDVISSTETIQFSRIGSNSYLTAEYDVGINKDKLSMEIYSLHSGAIRRECWGNDKFNQVSLFTDITYIWDCESLSDILRKFYSTTGSCRLIGYYKAKFTAEAKIRILSNSTSSAWIFEDTIQPNFPTLPINSYQDVNKQTIQDKFYNLRIDTVYYGPADVLGVGKFDISYAGTSYRFSIDDMYYPIKTDYSPIDLSTLECNEEYFLPIPETNGSLICPDTNTACKKINYSTQVADTKFNPYCEKYRWENGIQICEKCADSNFLYDNICICETDYWQSYTTLKCHYFYRVVYEVVLYKV